MPRVSVCMPTYDQETFIARALDSLFAQTFTDWELLIIDDGSPGDVPAALRHFAPDARVHYHRLPANVGAGGALNAALDHAQGDLIAYLPSDDIYHAEHLASLVDCLDHTPTAVMVVSGVRYRYNKLAERQIEDYPIQPVQVMHRKTADRWIEREELVSDDWAVLYWNALREKGEIAFTNRVTCEWVWHGRQLHKLIREPEGGINAFRSHFQIQHPLRFKSTVGNHIDEVEHYRRFRDRPDTPPARDGLKILLVGELAYNAERVLAFEERGHRLYGLWMPNPHWYNTVGPLPFGHVEDIPYAGWRDAVKSIRPDVIYAQLNWQAVPFAHEILTHNSGVPFVWHFKESPFICLDRGTWAQLIDLYTRSDGQIYVSPEMRDWFAGFLPNAYGDQVLIMDADLPKHEWFTEEWSPLLSDRDGEIHTVVPGRPIGLHSHVVEELARERIHLHFYGDYTHGQWKEWIERTMGVAPGYLHLHPNVDQTGWVREFSQYDAGWLHFFESRNGGEIRRADWDDLNYPARLSTLAAAGLPALQRDNRGHIVATQSLLRRLGTGLFFRSIPELAVQLRDREALEKIRNVTRVSRHLFTFDEHTDSLIGYFRNIIG